MACFKFCRWATNPDKTPGTPLLILVELCEDCGGPPRYSLPPQPQIIELPETDLSTLEF